MDHSLWEVYNQLEIKTHSKIIQREGQKDRLWKLEIL